MDGPGGMDRPNLIPTSGILNPKLAFQDGLLGNSTVDTQLTALPCAKVLQSPL